MSATTAQKWMWSARPADRPARGIARIHRRLPAGLVLERRERVLAAVRLRGGGTAVSTDHELIIVSAQGYARRVRWTDIADAAWSPTSATTVVSLWPNGSEHAVSIAVPTDRRFAALAADQVAAAQVLRRRVQLTDAAAATVLATRSTGDDAMTWRVFVDSGHEDDPDIARAASRAVAELRALAGC
jgi:hypothetical protein